MGLNQSSPQLQCKKCFQDLYSVQLEACSLSYQLKVQEDEGLFIELMSVYSPYRSKYRWAQNIPLLMRRYFFNVLLCIRNNQIQSLYKALNVTLLSQTKQAKKDYQKSFYRNVNSSQLSRDQRTTDMLQQSILFEDAVVNKYSNQAKVQVDELFRQSIVCSRPNSAIHQNAFMMNDSVFIQNLPKESQEELALFIQFYARFSMVLESLVHSAAWISLPLRHFELQLLQDKKRKKIKPSRASDPTKLRRLDSTNLPLALRQSPEGEQRRRVIQHNQNLLLDMVQAFIQTYTDFVWGFYNLSKLEDIQYARLVDCENIFNLLTETVWQQMNWIGQRGYEYEQIKTQLYLVKEFQSQTYRKSVNQDILPSKVIEMACNLPLSPLKHLKQITKIYRIVAGLSKEMTADGLMSLYRLLLYKIAKQKKLRRLVRMMNIVNKLWKGQKFGQVGYAWTTWQAALNMALSDAIKHKFDDLIPKEAGSSIAVFEIE